MKEEIKLDVLCSLDRDKREKKPDRGKLFRL